MLGVICGCLRSPSKVMCLTFVCLLIVCHVASTIGLHFQVVVLHVVVVGNLRCLVGLCPPLMGLDWCCLTIMLCFTLLIYICCVGRMHNQVHNSITLHRFK